MVNMWKISWYPNVSGQGSGGFRAYTTAPTVYSRPPPRTRANPAPPSASYNCGMAIAGEQPTTTYTAVKTPGGTLIASHSRVIPTVDTPHTAIRTATLRQPSTATTMM